MIFSDKILVTLNNNIGYTGVYANFANYICIKQSDKSNLLILLSKDSIKSAINLKGNEVAFDENANKIDFTLLENKEYIIKLDGEITYAGVNAECNNSEINEILKESKLLCVNTELMIFVIMPKAEILKEWEY